MASTQKMIRKYVLSFQQSLMVLYERLVRARSLEPLVDRLRTDIFTTMNLMHKTPQNMSENELVAFIALDWAIIQGSDFIGMLEGANPQSKSKMLQKEKLLYTGAMKQNAHRIEMTLPKYVLNVFNFDDIQMFFHDLSLRLYRFFNLFMKMDGKLSENELEGFRIFWNDYRRLLVNTINESKIIPGDTKSQPATTEKPVEPGEFARLEMSKGSVPVPEVKLPALVVPMSQDDPVKQLDALIGLTEIKKEIKSLVNFVKVQELRKKEGMHDLSLTLHAVFLGKPGTGKTTVARYFAQCLHTIGYLSKGHLVETDRAGLVAGYVGQTAAKVDEVVRSALGGVLFIDEAYSLASGDEYGTEAIATLVNRIENNRNDLVVIAAGYEDEMRDFLGTNPGLASRFTRTFFFCDYTPAEMCLIFESFLKKGQFVINSTARKEVDALFTVSYNNRGKDFGNGRFVRNIFERIVQNQCNRLVNLDSITRNDLETITAEDILQTKKTISA